MPSVIRELGARARTDLSPPRDPAQLQQGRVYLIEQRHPLPGGWSGDRSAQSQHYTGTIFLALNAVQEMMATASFFVERRLRRDRTTFGPKGAVATIKAVTDHGGQGNDEDYAPEDDHILADIVRRPNNRETFPAMVAYATLQWGLTGNGPFWLVPGEGHGKPVELYPLVEALLQPAFYASEQYLEGAWWVNPYYPGGLGWTYGTLARRAYNRTLLPGTEVRKLMAPHPLTRSDGYSPLDACAVQFDIMESIDRSRHSAFMNGSQLGTIVYIPGLDQPGADAMAASYRERYGGPDNARKVGFFSSPPGTPGEAKIDRDPPPREMDYTNSWQQQASVVFAVFGQHAVTAGLKGATGYAEFYAAQMQVWGKGCGFVRQWGDFFTHWLAEPYCTYSGEYRIKGQLPKPRNEETRVTNILAGASQGIVFVNEARAAIDLEPVRFGDLPPALYAEKVKQVEFPQQQQPAEGDPLTKLLGGKDGGGAGEAKDTKDTPTGGAPPQPTNPEGKNSLPQRAVKSRDAAGHEHARDGKFTGPGDGGATGSETPSRASISGHDQWRDKLPEADKVGARPKSKAARKELGRHLQNAWTEARNALAAKFGTREINDRLGEEGQKIEGQLGGVLRVIVSGNEYDGPYDLGPVSDQRYAGYYKAAVQLIDKLRAMAAPEHKAMSAYDGAAGGAIVAPEARAWRDPAPYGYCPECREPGISCERRPNGNVHCANGHTFPFAKAKYASTQVELTGAAKAKLLAMARTIPDADLGEDGREDEPHITARYGLHADGPGEVREVAAGFGPVAVRIAGLNVFRGAETGRPYDVIYAEVDSPDLVRLNELLGQLPHTDTHAGYKPHATVAYVKAGLADKWLAVLGRVDETARIDRLTFSTAKREKTRISLTGEAEPTFELTDFAKALPPSEHHKEGDVWEVNGVKWTVKDGHVQRANSEEQPGGTTSSAQPSQQQQHSPEATEQRTEVARIAANMAAGHEATAADRAKLAEGMRHVTEEEKAKLAELINGESAKAEATEAKEGSAGARTEAKPEPAKGETGARTEGADEPDDEPDTGTQKDDRPLSERYKELKERIAEKYGFDSPATTGAPAPPTGPVATGRLADGSEVRFVPHPAADGKADQYTTVTVDVAKLDAAWAQDEGYYIPPGGGGAEIGGRRDGFARFLATGAAVQAPYVVLVGEKVGFEDGRHRFSLLRDRGLDRVAVTVPASQAAEFAARFGGEARASPNGPTG